MEYRLAVISDLHVCSQYALVPPSLRPAGGRDVFPAVAFMEYLWSCWEHFCTNCPPLDCLIVNGDIIEGENPSHRDSMDAITDNVLTQCRAAEEVLGMITPKAKTVYLIRGTPYHDSKYFEGLEAIAANLGAAQWSKGRYTGYVLEGTWRGLLLNVTHHQTTGAIYPGTLASRTALFAAAGEALAKVNHADLVIRSHLHLKGISKHFGRWVIQTPGWKLPNPYAIKKMEFMRANLLSDLGAILIETDGTGKVTIDDTSFEYPAYRAGLRDLVEANPETRPRRPDRVDAEPASDADGGLDVRRARCRKRAERPHDR